MSRSVAILLSIHILASAQDTEPDPKKYALGWTFQVGQTRELEWNIKFKIESKLGSKELPPSEVSIQMRGTLTIKEINADGSATGELLMHHQICKGRMSGGSEMDILVEDSKLKRPEGTPSEAGKKLIDSVLAPAKVRMSRRGNLEITEPHPLLSQATGPWPLMMGPILPWKKQVPVGESWLGKLQTPEWKAAGEPGFDVEYTFNEMTDFKGTKCARLLLNTKQTMRFQGADSTFTVKSTALFDPERGECVQDKLSGDITGGMTYQGEKFELTGTFKMEFSTLPQKQ